MEYHCTPDIEYECTVDQCKKITSGFQQAESFAYNTKTDELSACPWTNCYAAKAIVFKDTPFGTFTAAGRLMPSAHPGNEPIVVSLTIDVADTGAASDAGTKRTSGFTAVWGYGKQGTGFLIWGGVAFRNPCKIGKTGVAIDMATSRQ